MECGIGRRGYGMLLAGLASMLFVILPLAGCDKTQEASQEAGEESAEEQPQRMGFDELFDINGNVVTPKFIIRYNSTTMTPEVPFESQVMRFGDTPFADLIGHDAEVKREGMVYRIIRFY